MQNITGPRPDERFGNAAMRTEPEVVVMLAPYRRTPSRARFLITWRPDPRRYPRTFGGRASKSHSTFEGLASKPRSTAWRINVLPLCPLRIAA
jgi:hypothetical protein